MEELVGRLGRYKYLLLALVAGLLLILAPTSRGDSALSSGNASDTEARLEEVLCRVKGVGRVSVLCSEEGVAVVCEGAGSPQVRLYITEAVRSYTGMGSDRIRVLEMSLDD